MRSLYALYQFMRADFLERVRRHSFLVALGFIAMIGYQVVAGNLVLQLGSYRGLFNSAWVGANMTLVVNMILTLVGFYLVKNAVERDYQTRVGEIIATTPIGRYSYLLGKVLSNFAVLAVYVVVLTAFGMAMQLVHGEESQIQLVPFLAPMIVFGLSTMFLTSAVAVFFEVVPWLRGAFGNIVYLLAWGSLLPMAAIATDVPWMDWAGVQEITQSMQSAAAAQTSDYTGGFAMRAGPREELGIIRWDGLEWSPQVVLVRVLWMGIALAITGAAAALFDRFDPAQLSLRKVKPRPAIKGVPITTVVAPAVSDFHLPPLASKERAGNFWRVLWAELFLAFKGTNFWWRLIAVGLLAASLFAPMAVLRQGLVLAIWVWPLTVWSKLGCRENLYGTNALVFSAVRPLSIQFFATWLTGILFGLALGSGAIARLFMAGETSVATALIIASVFAPSLALALGVWSGGNRLFEVVYVLLWYLGPLNRTSVLDFLAVTDEAWQAGAPPAYFAAAIVLLLAGLAGRRLRLATG